MLRNTTVHYLHFNLWPNIKKNLNQHLEKHHMDNMHFKYPLTWMQRWNVLPKPVIFQHV